MPFLFSHVCDLLQQIENNLRTKSGQRNNATIVGEWFNRHRCHFKRDDFDGSALLSTLLPEKRTDRVYFVKARTLQRQIGRALCLQHSRIAELTRWEQPGSGVDLADCVEAILRTTPNAVQKGITVEELDDLLHRIASGCRFSSPTVKDSRRESCPISSLEAASYLYKRMSARDAKWLTRLILKDYGPVLLNEHLVYRSFHPQLPAVLKIQNSFTVATNILKTIERERGVIQGPLPEAELIQHLKPALGVKVGRQPFYKARSLKDCLEMGRGQMSCEQKVDGEYCQIHVDLSKGPNKFLQIFSKSGKDSTLDRKGIHDVICSSLRLGAPDCPIRSGCILEGELVVYSDLANKVLDFHKIRKHVSRSGVIFGKDMDSQPHEWEHLMIVYFDVLMIDDESLLSTKRSQRFQRLTNIISCTPGYAEIVRREVIDFNGSLAMSSLKRAFARSIAGRDEGLVLKTDDPYFDLSSTWQHFRSCSIKLKKEYIGNFGDVGDFAVVGARYDGARATELGIENLKWTHFYIACLDNKEDVERRDSRPSFVVTNLLEPDQALLKTMISHISPETVLPEENDATTIRPVEHGIDEGKSPTVIFPNPPVLDVRCFNFDKATNTTFWSPRFPMVNKIQFERTYRDVIAFDALQDMARREKETPLPDDSQEMLHWMKELERADPKSVLTDLSTQSTVRTIFSDTTVSFTASPASVVQRAKGTRDVVCDDLPPEITAQARLLTPARSSGVTAPSEPRVKASARPPTPSRTLKRAETSIVDHPSARKVRRFDGQTTPASSRTRTRHRGTPALHSPRPALADITKCSSPRDNASQSFVGRVDGTLSFPGPPTKNDLSSSLVTRVPPAAASFHAGAPGTLPPGWSTGFLPGKCRYRGDDCALRKFAIVLSPCIASYCWVTEDLLRAHGKSFVVAPEIWHGVSSRRQHPPPPPAGSRSTAQPKRRRVKKLALVEKQRADPTHEFLKRIESMGLTRPDGERDWVNVLDWRILEALTEEESKSHDGNDLDAERTDMRSINSIWRKHWVGLA